MGKNSEIIEIDIPEFEKHQGRRDVKRMSWFKVQTDLFLNPDYASRSSVAKLLFIHLVSEKNRNRFQNVKTTSQRAAFMLNTKAVSIRKAILELEEIQWIRVISRTDSVQICNEPVTDAIKKMPLEKKRKEKKREEKKRITKKIEPSETASIDTVNQKDIEKVYHEKYPRKEGKSKGLAKLKIQIKTSKDLEDFSRAVDSYREICMKEGKEKRFILHFSTFAGQWRDFLDEDHGRLDSEVEKNKAYSEMSLTEKMEFFDDIGEREVKEIVT